MNDQRGSHPPSKSDDLVFVPFEKLAPHPLNANFMEDALKAKLRAHIQRSGRYPPLIVRPFGAGYQILDGEQRATVLKEMGEEGAWSCIWDVDDEDAVLLLATLNRLQGEDLPARRAYLIQELQANRTLAELATLLPEDESELNSCLAAIDMDLEGLMAQLEAEASRVAEERPEVFTFAVERFDAVVVNEAIERAIDGMDGKNRRGRALVLMARHYMVS